MSDHDGDVYKGNSKSGFIKALPLEEYDAMVAKNAQLVAALRALCEDRPGKLPAGIADYDDEHYCIYCEKFDVYEPQQHKSDCPIRVARALLAGGGGA